MTITPRYIELCAATSATANCDATCSTTFPRSGSVTKVPHTNNNLMAPTNVLASKRALVLKIELRSAFSKYPARRAQTACRGALYRRNLVWRRWVPFNFTSSSSCISGLQGKIFNRPDSCIESSWLQTVPRQQERRTPLQILGYNSNSFM